MGALDTFDGAGYVALLRRLRLAGDEVVYAPEFRREIEEPINGAVAVPPDVPLVTTEGNYLLVNEGPWAEVRNLLDEAWYVVQDEETRLRLLIARHVEYADPVSRGPRPHVHRLSKPQGQKGMGGRPSPESRLINLQTADIQVDSPGGGKLLVSRDFAASRRPRPHD